MIRALVITSEDRAEHAEAVVEGVLRRAFQTHGEQLPSRRLVPEDIRKLTKAAMWRAKGSKLAAARLVTLVQYLAAQIDQGEAVVAFHFDADCAWPETPEATADFHKLRTRVEQILSLDRRDRLKRLVAIIPHWCIESWTYQHVAEAATICRELKDESSAKQFEALATNPGALDVTPRPHEDQRYRRLGREHNHRLATHVHYPASKVLELDASFAASIRALAAAIT